MNVDSILERKGIEVATIAPKASIKRAADWLRAKNVGALVVTSDEAIVGIISERDIVRAFSEYGEAVASMQVKDIMTHGLITASLWDDLTHLMRLMTRHHVRHMPVIHNGKLAGIVSIGDLLSTGWMIWNLKRASSAMSTLLATDVALMRKLLKAEARRIAANATKLLELRKE
jgi:CBS domain-containing protein